MTCRVKVVQLNEIYMCTEFHMNTCKYVWAIHQVFRLCSRGRRRAPVPRPGPSLCGVLMAADSNVCANFQEFSCMLRAPKPPKTLKKKIIIIIIILRKTRGPCALLAWALNIAASSDGGPKPSVQLPPRWHQEKGTQRAHAFIVTLWQAGFNWYSN